VTAGPTRALRACILCVVSVVCDGACAHLLNMTRIEIAIDRDRGVVEGTLDVDLTVALEQPERYFALSRTDPATRADALAPVIAELEAAVRLMVDDRRVPVRIVGVSLPDLPRRKFVEPFAAPMTRIVLEAQLPDALAAERARLVPETRFPFAEPIAITLADAASARTMTRWVAPGQSSPEFSLTPMLTADTPVSAEPSATSPTARDVAIQFTLFGFRHVIPDGWDHMLFVVGLTLGARTLRRLFFHVSLFTLAHSATIALTALGVIAPPVAAVEILIALSIVYVAAANVIEQRTSGARAPLVFAFGLVHGMGFAQAMSAITLPTMHFIGAIAAFNIGVELGQAVVVAALAPIVIAWRSRGWFHRRLVVPASAVTGGIAAVWVVERTLGSGTWPRLASLVG